MDGQLIEIGRYFNNNEDPALNMYPKYMQNEKCSRKINFDFQRYITDVPIAKFEFARARVQTVWTKLN